MFVSRRTPPSYVEQPCKSALNRVRGMPFAWSLNPYTGCAHRCTFCYVRAFEARADRDPGAGYGRTIRVKVNVAEMLRRELSRPTWRREQVAVGTATDPYQPAEGRYRLTRACLRELAEAWTPFTIVTRGPMILRDADLLLLASSRARVAVSVSVPTVDERVWRTTEPGTASPRRRLDVVRRLTQAGVDVGIAMAPLLPGLSDAPEQLAAVVREARAAGARSVWASLLHLRPGTREHFLAALARDWPEELGRYERLYAGRAYLPDAEARPVRERVGALSAAAGIGRRAPGAGDAPVGQLALPV